MKGNILKTKSPLNCHFSNEERDNYPNFLAKWQCVNLFVRLADTLAALILHCSTNYSSEHLPTVYVGLDWCYFRSIPDLRSQCGHSGIKCCLLTNSWTVSVQNQEGLTQVGRYPRDCEHFIGMKWCPRLVSHNSELWAPVWKLRRPRSMCRGHPRRPVHCLRTRQQALDAAQGLGLCSGHYSGVGQCLWTGPGR